MGAVILVQLLLGLAPGDAIDMLPNSEEARSVLAAEWHLDESLASQVVSYLADISRGNFRHSLVYRSGMAVFDVIGVPGVHSAWRLAIALLVVMLLGTSMAWWTSGMKRPPVRFMVPMVSIVPVFLLAHLLIHVLNSLTWYGMSNSWIARPEWFALPAEPSFIRTSLSIIVLAVGSGALSDVHTALENTFKEIRRSDYVLAARARGAPIWPHVWRNSLVPLIGVAARRIPMMIGGLVILEKIFLLNGIGSILWEAAILRDFPLATGITVVIAVVVASVEWIRRTSGAILDPRLRIERVQ